MKVSGPLRLEVQLSSVVPVAPASTTLSDGISSQSTSILEKRPEISRLASRVAQAKLELKWLRKGSGLVAGDRYRRCYVPQSLASNNYREARTGKRGPDRKTSRARAIPESRHSWSRAIPDSRPTVGPGLSRVPKADSGSRAIPESQRPALGPGPSQNPKAGFGCRALLDVKTDFRAGLGLVWCPEPTCLV